MPVTRELTRLVFVIKQCVKIKFMKHVFPLIFLLYLSNTAFSQDDGSLKRQLEKYVPYYLVENYCSKTGLNNIVKSAKVDDRVYGVSQFKGGTLADSTIVIRYNNSILTFEKYTGIPYLGIFNVYFSTQIEMDNFILYFLKIMDPTEEYFGSGLNNNLWPNSGDSELIEGAPYSVTCFVNQWDYCEGSSSSSSSPQTPTKRGGNVFMLDEWCTDTYTYTNPNKNIQIDCITESETQTLISFTATPSNEYQNGGWINFSPNAYIEVDSSKYYLEEYGGIVLAPQKKYFSNNQNISFTLYFEKVDLGNQTFNIIEGVDGGFDFYKIHKTN